MFKTSVVDGEDSEWLYCFRNYLEFVCKIQCFLSSNKSVNLSIQTLENVFEVNLVVWLTFEFNASLFLCESYSWFWINSFTSYKSYCLLMFLIFYHYIVFFFLPWKQYFKTFLFHCFHFFPSMMLLYSLF